MKNVVNCQKTTSAFKFLAFLQKPLSEEKKMIYAGRYKVNYIVLVLRLLKHVISS